MVDMRLHGPWKILQSHVEYQDPWIHVRRDDVIRPDNQPGSYTVVSLKPGVSVLAIDDAGHVCLTEEFHYGVGRVTIEVVSGGIESGEGPLLTAQRELAEELGITANEWAHCGVCDPFTASVVSPTQLYLARDLTFGEHQQEGTEQIRLVKMRLDEAVEAVMDGTITHGPSGVLILKAALLLKNSSSSSSSEG